MCRSLDFHRVNTHTHSKYQWRNRTGPQRQKLTTASGVTLLTSHDPYVSLVSELYICGVVYSFVSDVCRYLCCVQLGVLADRVAGNFLVPVQCFSWVHAEEWNHQIRVSVCLVLDTTSFSKCQQWMREVPQEAFQATPTGNQSGNGVVHVSGRAQQTVDFRLATRPFLSFQVHVVFFVIRNLYWLIGNLWVDYFFIHGALFYI